MVLKQEKIGYLFQNDPSLILKDEREKNHPELISRENGIQSDGCRTSSSVNDLLYFINEHHRPASSSSTIEKAITCNKASTLYERGINHRKNLTKKIEDAEREKSDACNSSSSKKKITSAQASAIYERGINRKKNLAKKIEDALNEREKCDAKPPSKCISLSNATAIYDRGMASRANAQKKLEDMRKIPIWK